MHFTFCKIPKIFCSSVLILSDVLPRLEILALGSNDDNTISSRNVGLRQELSVRVNRIRQFVQFVIFRINILLRLILEIIAPFLNLVDLSFLS